MMTPDRLNEMRRALSEGKDKPFAPVVWVRELLTYIDWLQGRPMADDRLTEAHDYIKKFPDNYSVGLLKDLLSIVWYLQKLIKDLQIDSPAYQQGVEDGKRLAITRSVAKILVDCIRTADLEGQVSHKDVDEAEKAIAALYPDLLQ